MSQKIPQPHRTVLFGWFEGFWTAVLRTLAGTTYRTFRCHLTTRSTTCEVHRHRELLAAVHRLSEGLEGREGDRATDVGGATLSLARCVNESQDVHGEEVGSNPMVFKHQTDRIPYLFWTG